MNGKDVYIGHRDCDDVTQSDLRAIEELTMSDKGIYQHSNYQKRKYTVNILITTDANGVFCLFISNFTYLL